MKEVKRPRAVTTSETSVKSTADYEVGKQTDII
jgi:hypothetical protein